MPLLSRKVGDRLPPLDVTLEDADGNAAALTGATVRFLMRLRKGGELKVDAAATIVSVPLGQVRYEFLGADVDTAGLYVAEFETTIAGLKQSYPITDDLLIEILPDLG